MLRIGAPLALAALLAGSTAGAQSAPVSTVDVRARNIPTFWTGLPATLYALGPDGAPQPCPLPCARKLDVGQRLYFGGEGVQPSKAFRFVVPGDASILVTSGAHARRVWSVVYFVVGSVAMATGAGVLTAGALSDDGSDLLLAGGLTAGAGLAMLVGGIIFRATSSTTFKSDAPVMTLDASGRSLVFKF